MATLILKMASKYKPQLAIIVILAVSVAARVWGLDFGLPHPWARPDESRLVNMAMKFGTGDLRPPFFNYPTLIPYLLTALYGLYFVLGKVIGYYSTVYDFVLEFAVNPTNFYLIGRAVSAISGAATVLVLYFIAAQSFGRRAALISALFLSLAFLHVRDSHFGATDVPMTFFIMLSVLCIMRCLDSTRLKYYGLAGLFAGLAASTKYAGLLLILPLLTAHFFNIRREENGIGRILFDRRPVFFTATMILAFLVATPYALFEPARFISDVMMEVRHLDTGHLGVMLGRGWWHHLRFTLFYGLGWPLLLGSFIGMILLFRLDARKALVLLFFPLTYYLWTGKGYTVFVRYIIPVVPFLCISAAVLVEYIGRKLEIRLDRKWAQLITWILAVIIILPSSWRVAKFDTLLSRTDNRVVAADWILKSIPKGSSVCQLNSSGGALQLEPGQFFVEKYQKFEAIILSGPNQDSAKSAIDLMVDSLKSARYFDDWIYTVQDNRFRFNGDVQDSLPDYILLVIMPLKYEDTALAPLRTLLDARYVIERDFIAFRGDKNLYDQQDHFYVPYAGFNDVIRPGPNVFVYRHLKAGHVLRNGHPAS